MCVHVCRTCHGKPAKLPGILLEMAKEEEGCRSAPPPPGREGRRLAPSASWRGADPPSASRRGAGQAPQTGGPPSASRRGAVRRGRRSGPLTGGPLRQLALSRGHLRRFAIGLDARARPRRSCPRGLRRGGHPRRLAPLKSYKYGGIPPLQNAFEHLEASPRKRPGTAANKSRATRGLAESLTCASLNRPHVLGRKSLASVGVLSSAIGPSCARP
ncbi:hypothetical protein Taro_000245 [Colocasia esculenta]|uniref:Uncharacterized protein n=1 Tax=Colocasia esculenta TaxID=4460 RepID=A0A843TED8_COLES|nr:hypothetical protein [Colocasia esculenta]